MEQLARTLKEIGLSDNEAEVYVALASLDEATAYKIAQECDVKKPTVYVTLEDLRKKGLVLKVPHAKKQVFVAKDLEEYIAQQEADLKRARSALPLLRTMSAAPHSRVLFFSGLRGLAEAMDYKLDSMRGKTFLSFYEDLTGSDVKKVSDLYSKWDEKALAMGISFEVVMGRTYSDRHYYKDLVALSRTSDQVRIKYLEKYEYPPNVSVEIADDFVRITNDKALQSTIIDDKQAANAMRQIFKIVWERGA